VVDPGIRTGGLNAERTRRWPKGAESAVAVGVGDVII